MVKPLPRPKEKARKPGPPKRDEEDIRSNRITMRVHDDLMDLLTLRSREAGVSRSAYIERLLLAWLRADPRNPKLDAMGKLSAGQQAPRALREADPVRTAERWTKFSGAHDLLFGQNAPRHWLDDLESYWPSAYVPNDYHGDDNEGGEPEPRAHSRHGPGFAGVRPKSR